MRMRQLVAPQFTWKENQKKKTQGGRTGAYSLRPELLSRVAVLLRLSGMRAFDRQSSMAYDRACGFCSCLCAARSSENGLNSPLGYLKNRYLGGDPVTLIR